MKKKSKQILILIGLVVILILPFFVFAQNPSEGLNQLRPHAGYAEADVTTVSEIIGIVVRAVFSLLGVIFTVLMLYGGYNWMTAAGDEGKLTTAKNTIRRAIIGLVITAGSYAIWDFVFRALFLD